MEGCLEMKKNRKSTKGFDVAIISLVGLTLLIAISWISEYRRFSWISEAIVPGIFFGTVIAILLYLRRQQ